MVELGFTYDTLAPRVAKLSRRAITPGYISHIMNGRRRAEYLWPYLAQALDAPLAYLTDPNPRRILSHEPQGEPHYE